MTNQATGASKSDIGKRAIVCGYSDRGTITGVTGRTVTLEMPHGKMSMDQDKVVVMPDPVKKVRRYALVLTGVPQTVAMPDGAKVLRFQTWCSEPAVWAEVDDSQPKAIRRFQLLVTGEETPAGGQYIGTVQQALDVWHLYELA